MLSHSDCLMDESMTKLKRLTKLINEEKEISQWKMTEKMRSAAKLNACAKWLNSFNNDCKDMGIAFEISIDPTLRPVQFA